MERAGCVSVVLRLVMLAGATPPENHDMGIERPAKKPKASQSSVSNAPHTTREHVMQCVGSHIHMLRTFRSNRETTALAKGAETIETSEWSSKAKLQVCMNRDTYLCFRASTVGVVTKLHFLPRVATLARL